MNGKMKPQNGKRGPPFERCLGNKELHNRGFKNKMKLENLKSEQDRMAREQEKPPRKSFWGKRLLESAAAMVLATGLSACEGTTELRGDARAEEPADVRVEDTREADAVMDVIEEPADVRAEDTEEAEGIDVVDEPCELQFVEETRSISLHPGEYEDVGGLRWQFDEVEVHIGIEYAIISVLDPCTGAILKRDKVNDGEDGSSTKYFRFALDGVEAEAAVETTSVVPGYTRESQLWEATITMTVME